MSNNSNYVSKQLGGVSYSLRMPPAITWKNVIGSSLGMLAMIPFMVLNSLYQLAFPSSRKKIQATMVPKMMAGVEKEFQGERERLLSRLAGTVLDVGSGAGPYLKYCNNATEVVAIEPLVDLHPSIQTAGASLRKLTILKDLSELKNSTEPKFDWVILGNVGTVLAVQH